jgi:hypothetical protein
MQLVLRHASALYAVATRHERTFEGCSYVLLSIIGIQRSTYTIHLYVLTHASVITAHNYMHYYYSHQTHLCMMMQQELSCARSVKSYVRVKKASDFEL